MNDHLQFCLECLTLMKFEHSKSFDGGLVFFEIKKDGKVLLTKEWEHSVIDFTIQELIKRDEVMERVKEHTGYLAVPVMSFGEPSDSEASEMEYLLHAIELGITPKELMGVEQ